MNILQDIAKRYNVSLANTDYELKKQITLKMRSRLSANALLGAKPDQEIRIDFLYMFEGLRLDAYYENTSLSVASSYCPNSCISVGCGFNMSRPEAKKEWSAVLPRELFDEVYDGRQNLTLKQVSLLLEHSLNQRVIELINLFGEDCWYELPESMQIALESIYYNIPGLITSRRSVGFIKMIREFVTTGEMILLYKAGKMLFEYQHKIFHHVLHRRRRIESLLLCGIDDIYDIDYMLERELEIASFLNKEPINFGGMQCMAM